MVCRRNVLSSKRLHFLDLVAPEGCKAGNQWRQCGWNSGGVRADPEGLVGWWLGCGEGVALPIGEGSGEGLSPLLRIKWIFRLKWRFWCTMRGIFVLVLARKKCWIFRLDLVLPWRCGSALDLRLTGRGYNSQHWHKSRGTSPPECGVREG